MRIVAGRWGGRRLVAPPGVRTRPTSDRVREALFSILADRTAGATVWDLFAGSGALGLEALSRGAEHVTFVERDRRTAAILRQNADQLRAEPERHRVVVEPVARFLRRAEGPVKLILCDPPYADGPEAARLVLAAAARRLAPGGLVVLEHGVKDVLEAPDGLRAVDARQYGDTALFFGAPVESAP